MEENKIENFINDIASIEDKDSFIFKGHFSVYFKIQLIILYLKTNALSKKISKNLVKLYEYLSINCKDDELRITFLQLKPFLEENEEFQLINSKFYFSSSFEKGEEYLMKLYEKTDSIFTKKRCIYIVVDNLSFLGTQDSEKQIFEYLEKGYSLDKNDPIINIKLSMFYYNKLDFQKSLFYIIEAEKNISFKYEDEELEKYKNIYLNLMKLKIYDIVFEKDGIERLIDEQSNEEKSTIQTLKYTISYLSDNFERGNNFSKLKLYFERYFNALRESFKIVKSNKGKITQKTQYEIGFLIGSNILNFRNNFSLIYGLLDYSNKFKYTFFCFESYSKDSYPYEDVNFVDISKLTMEKKADIIRKHCLDILIDIDTSENTLEPILLLNLAPVLIRYLNNQFLSNSNLYDYVILPNESNEDDNNYSEKRLTLKNFLTPLQFMSDKAKKLKTDKIVFGAVLSCKSITDNFREIVFDVLNRIEGSICKLVVNFGTDSDYESMRTFIHNYFYNNKRIEIEFIQQKNIKKITDIYSEFTFSICTNTEYDKHGIIECLQTGKPIYMLDTKNEYEAITVNKYILENSFPEFIFTDINDLCKYAQDSKTSIDEIRKKFINSKLMKNEKNSRDEFGKILSFVINENIEK